MKRIAALTLLALTASLAFAKLSPPGDEAQAKAAEAAAKSAHNSKVEGYKLCLAMDRVAAGYQATARKSGKPASAPTETPACADPGPFVYTPVAAAPAPAAPAPAAPASTVAASTAPAVTK